MPEYLTFCDEVEHETVGPLIAAIEAKLEEDAEAVITVYLTTNGGDLHAALGYYDRVTMLLRRYPLARLYTVAQGILMSSGLIMLQAATRRFSFPHTLLLMHESQTRVTGSDVEARASTLAALVKVHDLVTKDLCGVLAAHTGVPASEWKNRMAEASDIYFTPVEAKKWGLIDEILLPSNVVPIETPSDEAPPSPTERIAS